MTTTDDTGVIVRASLDKPVLYWPSKSMSEEYIYITAGHNWLTVTESNTGRLVGRVRGLEQCRLLVATLLMFINDIDEKNSAHRSIGQLVGTGANRILVSMINGDRVVFRAEDDKRNRYNPYNYTVDMPVVRDIMRWFRDGLTIQRSELCGESYIESDCIGIGQNKVRCALNADGGATLRSNDNDRYVEQTIAPELLHQLLTLLVAAAALKFNDFVTMKTSDGSMLTFVGKSDVQIIIADAAPSDLNISVPRTELLQLAQTIINKLKARGITNALAV